MKIIWLLSFLLPLLSLGQPEAGGGEVQGVRFVQNVSWQTVLQQAREQGKYIFVDCFATWCGPCKAMDRGVYPLDSVGALVNQRFISIKLQCDTSKSDGDEVKARYSDAHRISAEYEVSAYPTFLFFTPNGEIVHKGVGFCLPSAFISLIKDALDKDQQYFTLLKAYRDGRLGWEKARQLATKARKLHDTGVATSVGRTYIENYLDKLPEGKIAKQEDLEFVANNSKLLTVEDGIFVWLFHHEKLADSIMDGKDWKAMEIIGDVIYREKVGPAINTAKKVGNPPPDWSAISSEIVRKYGGGMLQLVYKGETEWYELKKDSENYCAAAIMRVTSLGYHQKVTDEGVQNLLNNVSWQIFTRSNDPQKLATALNWTKLVQKAMKDSDSLFVAQVLDTQANILYKLGRREEALSVEIRAEGLCPKERRDKKSISNNLQKMKEGKPTW